MQYPLHTSPEVTDPAFEASTTGGQVHVESKADQNLHESRWCLAVVQNTVEASTHQRPRIRQRRQRQRCRVRRSAAAIRSTAPQGQQRAPQPCPERRGNSGWTAGDHGELKADINDGLLELISVSIAHRSWESLSSTAAPRDKSTSTTLYF